MDHNHGKNVDNTITVNRLENPLFRTHSLLENNVMII